MGKHFLFFADGAITPGFVNCDVIESTTAPRCLWPVAHEQRQAALTKRKKAVCAVLLTPLQEFVQEDAMNDITEVLIQLHRDEYYRVRITKVFPVERGGGVSTIDIGGAYKSLHFALDAAKCAITLAPEERSRWEAENGRLVCCTDGTASGSCRALKSCVFQDRCDNEVPH